MNWFTQAPCHSDTRMDIDGTMSELLPALQGSNPSELVAEPVAQLSIRGETCNAALVQLAYIEEESETIPRAGRFFIFSSHRGRVRNHSGSGPIVA